MKKAVAILVLIFTYQIASSQSWTQKPYFYAAALNRAASFSIPSLGKGYVIAGYSYIYNTNAWAFDTLSNTWSPIASFPGAQSAQVAFSIGNYGYVGTGTGANYTYDSTFWKYDPVANTWTKLANFPGASRAFAVGFSAGGYGYIGCGCNGKPHSANGLKDFYKYNPSTNTWSAITNYPGNGSIGDVSFTIGSNGYVGTGSSIDTNFIQTTQQDFYQYNTTSGWTNEANFEGGTRGEAMTFSTCKDGYVGCGYSDGWQSTQKNDFWKYDPVANSWSSITNFGGGDRAYGMAFSIGKSAFAGMGRATSGTPNVGDWWEYTTPLLIDNLVIDPQEGFVCSGATIILNVAGSGSDYSWSPWQGLSATTGDTVIANPTTTRAAIPVYIDNTTIVYTVIGLDSVGCPASGTDTITVASEINIPNITVSVTGDTLISSATSDNQWYRDDTLITGATGSIFIIGNSSTAPGNAWYYVVVTNDANGCSSVSDSVHWRAPIGIIQMPIKPGNGINSYEYRSSDPLDFYNTDMGYVPSIRKNEIKILSNDV